VDEVDIGWGPEILDGCMDYLTHLFGGALSMELEDHGDLMTTYCRKLAEDGRSSTSQHFVRSLEVAGQAYLKLGPLLENYDCLICPTNALPAVPADFDPSSDALRVAGQDVRPELGWVMTTPFNMMSRCPVISVPSGFATNGVPTGLQIVAPTYRDEIAMQAAMAFETAAGGWFGPGGRPSL
jgi:amidase